MPSLTRERGALICLAAVFTAVALFPLYLFAAAVSVVGMIAGVIGLLVANAVIWPAVGTPALLALVCLQKLGRYKYASSRLAVLLAAGTAVMLVACVLTGADPANRVSDVLAAPLIAFIDVFQALRRGRIGNTPWLAVAAAAGAWVGSFRTPRPRPMETPRRAQEPLR